MSTILSVHVAISLVGIVAGFVVTYGFLAGKRLDGWTALFLGTTIATSLSGFLLPAKHFMPSHVLAILSVVALGVAVYARYDRKLTSGWRNTYVVTALIAQYLNVFVLFVQSFQKVPVLRVLAPTQSELPFVAVQLLLLLGFVTLGAYSVFRSRASLAAPVVSR